MSYKLRRRISRRFSGCRIEALESRQLLSNAMWMNDTSGSWSVPGNWSTDAVPQPGDNVTINQPGNIQVTLSGSTSIGSLSVTGDTLTISNATLTVAGSSSIGNSGTLTLNTANLDLASGTTLTNSGSITVNPGSELNIGSYNQLSNGKLTMPSGVLGTGVGTNLLSNPGFESPSADGSTTTSPSVWGLWGSSYVNTQYAHSGAQSVQESGANSGVYQGFSVTPGVSYSASVYAMTTGLTGPQGAFWSLTFTDSAGDQLSGSYSTTLFTSTSAAGGPIAGSVGGVGWNLFTATVVAPANATTVTEYMNVGAYTGQSGTAGGSVYWDDAQFGPTATTKAIVNASGGFTNSGAISIGASDSINITGTFFQGSTGTLTTLLGGPPGGNMFGSIIASGSATLGGTLSATLVNGYSPSISDGFNVLTDASQTGTFASFHLPSSSSYVFQPAINPQYVGISAIPVTLSTTVNINTAIASASPDLVGVNLAYWDDKLTTSQTAQMVESAGLSIFRFPGGSASDDFHFNVADNYGDSAANTIPQFAEFIQSVGGVGIVTTDYGSGSPQEAEAELAYLEGSPSDNTVIGNGIEWNDTTGQWQTVNWQTVGYWAGLRAAAPLATDDGYNFLRISHPAPFSDVEYWEIGNEEYGSWETDHHGTNLPNGTSTGAQHDPTTYAAFAEAFASFIKNDQSTVPSSEALPSVKIGIDSGDPTGASDNNWTKNVLTAGAKIGFVPGFISDHSYMYGPGQESDPFLLNDTVSNPSSNLDWSVRYNDYQTMLQQIDPSAASSVLIMATEFNSNYGTEGKQMSSLVNGLFIADSIGSLLNSGYSGGLVWDLRNGWTTDGNNSPSLYGWREGGDEGILGDPNYTDLPSTGAYVPYPSYFGEQLASKIMKSGGLAVSTVSNYNELSVYSVLEANGHLELLVINKNPDASLTDQFTVPGFTPDGQAQIWQYGEVQDYAQSISTTGSSALANSNTSVNFTGNKFSYTFSAYSMTVIDLSPAVTVASAAAANPNPVVGTSTALSAMGSENSSGAGLIYTWSATGPGSVIYTGNTNGTNAASSITANFTQYGNYNFTVTITDPGGQTVTSSVPVLVVPVFASQSGSTLNIFLNNFAPVAVSSTGNSISVSEDGVVLAFTGISAVVVNGSANSDVLNFNGPVATPFTFTGAATTTLNVNSGALNIGPSGATTLEALSIASSASAAMPTGSATQWELNSLTIAAGGSLNIAGNTLLIDFGTGADPAGALASDIASGQINSSTAGPGYGIGYIDGDTDSGTDVPAGEVEIAPTLIGDVNLEGTVNLTDLLTLLNNYGLTGQDWAAGDTNYDGTVNLTDLLALLNNYGESANLTAASTAIAPLAEAVGTPPTTPAKTVYSAPGVFASSRPIGSTSADDSEDGASLVWLDSLSDVLGAPALPIA